MITQEDIAKKHNISRAAVSMAPSNVAPILASKNLRVVYAFVIATVDEGYGEQTYNGIRDAANIWSGYNIEFKVIFTDIMEKGDQAKRQLEQFDEMIDNNKVDDIIFSALSKRNMDHVSKKCKKNHIPLMTLDMIYSGIIRAIVSARPYFMGAVVTNNFFRYFFQSNDCLRGIIDVTCDIYS